MASASWLARKAIEDCLYAAEVAHTGRIHTAYAVFDALRSLPVEQRMEALGMLREQASFDGGMTFQAVWVDG